MGMLHRLLFPVGLVIVTALGVHNYLTLNSGIKEALEHHKSEAAEIFKLVGPVLIEQSIVGDYIAIKDLLDSQAQTRSNIRSLTWIAPNGAKIMTQTPSVGPSYPPRFATLVGLQAQRDEFSLNLGGVPYGAMAVETDPTPFINKLWTEFVQQLIHLVVITVVVMITITIILRSNLRTLNVLADGLTRFRRGEHHVRIHSSGAKEIRVTVDAFNSLADQVQSLLADLSANRSEMREQLHFTQELIEVLPFPVFYQDPKGCYLGVNNAWEKFFGLTKEQARGHLSDELFAGSPNETQFKRLLSNSNPVSLLQQVYELSIVDCTGKTHYVMYYRAVFTDANGIFAGTVGTFIDFSERKRAEERARTALVDKLSAESANKAKSAFLANMSHEIRTPLTAIIGFSETLLDADSTMEERVEAINTIIRSGKHLLQIINDILDLSKIEAEKLSVEKLSVPIFPLLEDLRALASMQAADKGIRFTIDHVYPLPESIYSDPVRLKQILLNLVNNAIKFTNAGSVTIRVSYRKADSVVKFDVIDTGVGMSPEQIERLFTPFAQADTSTTRRFGGTGLGLYLSKLLAEKLGGTVDVTSAPEQGSTFTATVSAGENEDLKLVNEAPHKDASSASMKSIDRPLVTGHILLADDNFDNQRLISLYIKKMGASVDVAENGRIAVEKALTNKYDLVFMDIQMPIMDGLSATKQLRRTGYTGPIVALTANAMQEDAKRCLDAGCTEFLPKPIDQARFNDTVKRFLGATAERSESGEKIRSTLAEEDPEIVDLINRFVERYPAVIERIAELLHQRDWDKLKKEIHDLKGVGGGYGFARISELAAKAEFAIAKQNYAEAEAIIVELDRLKTRLAGEAVSTDA